MHIIDSIFAIQDNKIVPSDRKANLTIQKLTNSTTYECRAANEVGSVAKQFIIQLGTNIKHPTKSSDVSIEPHIAGTKTARYRMPSSGPLALSCVASGWPKPKVNWYNVSIYQRRVFKVFQQSD